MKTHLALAIASLALALAACDDPSTSSTEGRITCNATPDCVDRGGTCQDGVCRADNECAADADCATGQICVADPDFGGLCATPGAPVQPLPAWSCSVGRDCPTHQGCGSDGACHVDGECQVSAGTCGAGQSCFASGGGDDGFCADERPDHDPTCRADGAGGCRQLCATDDACGFGGTCAGGFCHGADECTTDADCSFNHHCAADDWGVEHGTSACAEDENPVCVDDGHGACRLQCAADADCLHGGGCSADGLCHASNECAADADCDAGLICYPDPEFLGLCGPPRP